MFKGIDRGIFWVKDQPVSLSTAPKGTLDVTAFRDVVPKTFQAKLSPSA